jgi:transcriptional regulator with XRE-family HTH domain
MYAPIGLYLYLIRRQANYTLRETSCELGITHAYLDKIENFDAVPKPGYKTSKGPIQDVLARYIRDTIRFIKDRELKTQLTFLSNNIVDMLYYEHHKKNLISLLIDTLSQHNKENPADFLSQNFLQRKNSSEHNELESWYVFSSRIENEKLLSLMFQRSWGEYATKRKTAVRNNSDISFSACESKGKIGVITGRKGTIRRIFDPEKAQCFVYQFIYMYLQKIKICDPPENNEFVFCRNNSTFSLIMERK